MTIMIIMIMKIQPKICRLKWLIDLISVCTDKNLKIGMLKRSKLCAHIGYDDLLPNKYQNMA